MDGNCRNGMIFCKFFIPSLIGFTSLTRPSFKSFCMSLTGLKCFESSCCVLKSTTRSDKKCCWMFCLDLRNSLPIKSLFFGSVILEMTCFISYILNFSNMVLSMVLNMICNKNSSRNTNLISSKQFISFSFYITNFFQGSF